MHGATAGGDAVCSAAQAEQLLESDPTAVVTFLGDIFDRGTEPVVVLLDVLLLKIRYPRNVYILRGNHEVGAWRAVAAVCVNLNLLLAVSTPVMMSGYASRRWRFLCTQLHRQCYSMGQGTQ
jgi:hypothetical protein